MSILLALAASQMVVAGDRGPELHDLPPRAEVFAVEAPEVSTPKEPKCLGPSRAFNYASQALDIASTVAAIDRGAVEANPIITAVFGKRPKAHELILFKAIPLFGFRMLDEHLVRNGKAKKACVLNIGLGVPALVAAGLNARFVF